MRSLLSLAVIAVTVLASGCSKRSEKFCLMNPADDRCATDGGDIPCDDANPCTEGVCQNNVCVECTAADDSECVEDKPFCNVTTNRCEPCSQHSECDSRACLPSGACGTDTNVAYVSSTGTTNGTCSFEMPCLTVLEGLMRGRDHVKISGNIIEAVDLNNRKVTFLAEPNAKLLPPTGMTAVTIRGTSDVAIYDLTITGGSTDTGRGVFAHEMSKVALHRVTVENNSGGGVFVSGPAALTISRSTISKNRLGGIEATGTNVKYDITNSFIVGNGESSLTFFGGVNLQALGTPRFEFNTVVDNIARVGEPAGVKCAGELVAANNIIARNTPIQTSTGSCMHLTSIVQDTVDGLNFEEPDVAPLSYKLTLGSIAIDKPTTPSDIAIDFEGDLRPTGAVDLGADEFTP